MIQKIIRENKWSMKQHFNSPKFPKIPWKYKCIFTDATNSNSFKTKPHFLPLPQTKPLRFILVWFDLGFSYITTTNSVKKWSIIGTFCYINDF